MRLELNQTYCAPEGFFSATLEASDAPSFEIGEASLAGA
jgi:hypothetical protein